jgi:hypothetical protein
VLAFPRRPGRLALTKEFRMSLEDHKALVRKAYLEAFNQRNLDLIDEVFAPEYVV